MDAPRYRALMRHQAGAVAIIAAGREGARGGLTATAFSSLSDNPPMLLVCVQRKSGTHGVIVDSKSFSVNILAREQQDLAERFSGKGGLAGEKRFEGGGAWSTLATGAPVLAEALASLDCELVDEHQFSTHSIFIGRVIDGQFRHEGEPLLYFRNDYWDIGAR
jgi:flavin reductase (DIM6/NTAB) family NADH-FMN oxidoreductase RutF